MNRRRERGRNLSKSYIYIYSDQRRKISLFISYSIVRVSNDYPRPRFFFVSRNEPREHTHTRILLAHQQIIERTTYTASSVYVCVYMLDIRLVCVARILRINQRMLLRVNSTTSKLTICMWEKKRRQGNPNGNSFSFFSLSLLFYHCVCTLHSDKLVSLCRRIYSILSAR